MMTVANVFFAFIVVAILSIWPLTMWAIRSLKELEDEAQTIMNDIARICAERRAAEAANDIDRLLAENAQLAEKAKRFEQAANELRDSHLDALETISNGIAREDAMRAEIARLGDKLCAATQTISELNDRIVSANLLERAKRTGVPA